MFIIHFIIEELISTENIVTKLARRDTIVSVYPNIYSIVFALFMRWHTFQKYNYILP